MSELRCFPAQCFVELMVFCQRREPLLIRSVHVYMTTHLSSEYMSDFHEMVVDHTGKVICRP